jgi:hypothetical protein
MRRSHLAVLHVIEVLWLNTVGTHTGVVAGMAQTKHCGLARVGWLFTLKAAAYNSVRLLKLLPTG